MDFEAIAFLISIALAFMGREGLVIFAHFAIYQLISFFGLYEIGAFYYVIAAVIDFCIFYLATKCRLNLLVMTALCLSIFCNAISFIEYNTSYSFVYNLYEYVQAGLAVMLLTGATYGWINNLFRSSRTSDPSRGELFFLRGAS